MSLKDAVIMFLASIIIGLVSYWGYGIDTKLDKVETKIDNLQDDINQIKLLLLAKNKVDIKDLLATTNKKRNNLKTKQNSNQYKNS